MEKGSRRHGGSSREALLSEYGVGEPFTVVDDGMKWPRFTQMTIGRTFLLWLLGVLVLTLVLVSALVLWHERRILEDEMTNQAQLLARTLAVAAAGGGSPEFLAVASMGDLRAGEVRSADGGLLWRYGPSLEEVAVLDPGLLRIQERVEVGPSPTTPTAVVDVVLLLSRSRMDRHLATSAVRLVTALGLVLALALLVGMDLVGRVVRPLRALADSARSFQAEEPMDPPTAEAHAVEVRDLAAAFRDMASRLAQQRQSLAASEQRFKDLFTSSPTPLLELNDSLEIRGANPAAESFLGCDLNEAKGRPVAGFLVGIREEDLVNAVQASKNGLEAVVEARWQLAGGERAEVELHVRPARDQGAPGSLMAIHDVTDRVRRLGERWRRTFDAMVDGVALVDPAGAIVLANRALTRDLDRIRPLVEEQLRVGDECDWRAENQGRLLQCSLTSPKGLGHSILVVRDVTDQVRTEGRLREAEKMQAVGTLASGVAHDFNNLLAAIQLHCRWLLREPQASPEAGAAIRDLADEGIEVVRELLLFARRESTPPRTVDLAALVAGQHGVLSHLMPAFVALEVDVGEQQVPVVGNPVALRRLLLNLVLNARDALVGQSGDGDQHGQIDVRIRTSEDSALLEVADNGPGISPEHQNRLFEPFFSLKRHGRGAGLGLAVVYAIVTEHDGEIELSSDGRSGSTFRVRLPLGSPLDLEPLEIDNASGAVEDGRRVLLVDDDGREAARLVESMAAAGLEVRHATTLEAATELVRTWSPAAVVVPDALPEGNIEMWAHEIDPPTVILASASSGGRDRTSAGSVVVERTAAPHAVVAALYRIGVRGVDDSSSET
jgi:PAS domain S-box-containing protein